MVRLRLADAGVASLTFDLPGRTLTVTHTGSAEAIRERLEPLGYGVRWLESLPVQQPQADAVPPQPSSRSETPVLWLMLALNAIMFVVEVLAGWWGRSAGLMSDGVDMLADAAVYGVALYAAGRTSRHQLLAARVAGGLQMLLAVGALAEVVRRVVDGGVPREETMVAVSLLALAVNVTCLWLVARHRGAGVHMRASYIFSANDVLANLGVIAAGALVAWTGSPWPDWIIGSAIGTLVLLGAVRILRLR